MNPVESTRFHQNRSGNRCVRFPGGQSGIAAEHGAGFPIHVGARQARQMKRAAEVFKSGGSLLDAIEKGINVPESDPNVTSVGYGGIPNAEGVVELDAAIMDGGRHRAGSVCNLHMIKNPISVARLVMEKTRHTTLAGDGAFRFALKMGFEPQTLLTPQSLQKWQEWKVRSPPQNVLGDAGKPRHHRHGGDGWERTRRGRLLDLWIGVQNSWPSGRFTTCRLRRLR